MLIKVPQVDKVLRHPSLQEMERLVRRDILTRLVRGELQTIKTIGTEESASIDAVAESVCRRARALLRPALRKVVNGTGIVLNTNLGRAPLPIEVLEELIGTAEGYCNLEFDLQTGKRGKRSTRISELLQLLTGCQKAIVVNNNAAAVLLAVNCFARNKEVIVSRGELIEIGGSFRLPDVIESGGASLKEVGTTNRTRLRDYVSAISERTGMIIKCHRSNFEVVGFTEEVDLPILAQAAKEHGIPLLEDLGSGVLFDLSEIGLSHEPTVEESLAQGCDLVCFSGDKLLGGPQAGIIAGRSDLVTKLAEHPLYRALRPDKLCLRILEHILCQYLTPDMEAHIPVLKMIGAPASDIKLRAERFVQKANSQLTTVRCSAVETVAKAGGGSLPGESVTSFGVTLNTKRQLNEVAAALRNHEPPVIAIVQENRIILDFRTISPADEDIVLSAIKSLDKIH